MNAPQPIELPDGYHPNDDGQPQLRYAYKQGDRSPEAKAARANYMAWRARNANIETAVPAPAETPRTAPAERPSAPPAETRPVTPTPPPSRLASVPTLPATRRLQGLAWMGWDPESLHTEIGLEAAASTRLMFAPPDEIPAKLDQILRAGFRRLIVSPRDRDQPRAALWRDIARIAGWASPYQWDDIDHDSLPKHKATATEQPATEDEAVPFAGQERITELELQIIQLETDAEKIRESNARLRARNADIDDGLREASHKIKAAQDEADGRRRALAMAEQERDAAERQLLENTAALAEAEQHAAHFESLVERIAQLEADVVRESTALAREQEEHAQTRSAHAALLHSYGELEKLTAGRPRQEATGRVVVEQTPDGGSRIVFESSRPAQIHFAGLQVSVSDVLPAGELLHGSLLP